jgi:hypothetical protein
MDPAQPSPTQAGPAPTSPQPAGGPAQTTASNQPAQQQAGPSSGPNAGPSAGPSKLAMSVVKSVQANDKATQQMAVQNAAKTLEGSIQSSQASSNAAISMVQDMSANSAVAAATFASQSTQSSIQSSQQFNQQQIIQNSVQTQQTSRMTQQVQQQQDTQTTQVQSNVMSGQVQQFIYTPPPQQQDTQSTQVAMLKPPTPTTVETQQASSGNGITINRNLFTYNPLMSSSSASVAMVAPQTSTMYQPKLDNRQTELETPQYQVSSFSGSRAGNPLSELLTQQKFELMQTTIAPTGSSVNRNVTPNELAAGVDIASIATVPTGFNAYSFVLKDAAFYEPKEVYKNQTTVDNVRALRQLASDRLHQQMIELQYKIGE